MATSTAGRAPSYWCRVPLRRGSRVRILRASDDLQEGQRDRQASEAGSFSERLAVFLFCIVFKERMVQVASTRVHQRILAGMGLIVLHSGHYSKIFKRLMGSSCSLKWREADDRERLWVTAP